MSGLKKIKFSYPYAKLYDLDSKVYAYSLIARATLLGVFEVKLEDLHKSFLQYDTDNCVYLLPKKGKYLMLLFLKPGQRSAKHLFTTLRRYTPRKYEYYFDSVGEEFEVIIEEGK